MRCVKLLFVTILSLSFSSAYAASMMVNSSGVLYGAEGVEVEDMGTYNVMFSTGTCVYIYAGCDSVDDFVFKSSNSAIAAAQALLDQVLIGIFDDTPSNVVGCNVGYCEVHTPYALGTQNGTDKVQLRYARNTNIEANDTVNYDFFDIMSLSVNTYGPYAQWTQVSGPSGPDLTATPIPAALPLFLTGIAAIGWFRRKKVQAALKA